MEKPFWDGTKKYNRTVTWLQILLALLLSAAMGRLVLKLHEFGPAEHDHSYAVAVLILFPLTLIITLSLVLLSRPTVVATHGTSYKTDFRLIFRIFWITFVVFWIVTLFVSYVF